MNTDILTPDRFDPSTIYVSETDYLTLEKSIRLSGDTQKFVLPKDTESMLSQKYLVEILCDRNKYGDDLYDYEDIPTGYCRLTKFGEIWLEFKRHQILLERRKERKFRITTLIAVIALVLSLASLLWQIKTNSQSIQNIQISGS